MVEYKKTATLVVPSLANSLQRNIGQLGQLSLDERIERFSMIVVFREIISIARNNREAI